MTGTRTVRLLGAVLAALLVAGSAVALSWTRSDRADLVADGPTRSPSPTSSSASPTAEPSPSASEVADLPTDPAEAEAMGADALLVAGRHTATGAWSDLGVAAWPVDDERPVYVVRATLTDRRRVEADVAIALRSDADRSELVLRLLAASRALAVTGTSVEVTVSRDGQQVASEVDADGARLLVPLDPPLRAGDATLVRIRLSYDLPDRRDVTDDGGPAGFGLLAWNPDSTVLGHWLPLLTVPTDEGPMIPWGDVGAFPVAIWSVVTETDATLVTGGEESDCPAEVQVEAACVWSRGTALRDVSAVAYDTLADVSGQVGGLRVHAVGAAELEGLLGPTLEVATGSAASFDSRFGPLAWRELDVAYAPLSGGAAGMEFPGLVVIRDDLPGRVDGGAFGAFVIAHEVAHQWFHALVGNGSLSSPVVDESLAQYLSVLFYDDAYGPAAADQLVAGSLVERYRSARSSGLVDEPPGQPLGDFAGSDAYGPLVYARAPLAWVAAEDAVGRDGVVAFLVAVVERYGLGFVGDDEMIAFAEQESPGIADVLRRYWLDPAPIR